MPLPFFPYWNHSTPFLLFFAMMMRKNSARWAWRRNRLHSATLRSKRRWPNDRPLANGVISPRRTASAINSPREESYWKIHAMEEFAGNGSETAKFQPGYPAHFTFHGSAASVRVNYS